MNAQDAELARHDKQARTRSFKPASSNQQSRTQFLHAFWVAGEVLAVGSAPVVVAHAPLIVRVAVAVAANRTS